MKLTKAKLKQLIHEEVQGLTEGKEIFKTKIKGMEKNIIRFDDEPHEDGTYFGISVNNNHIGTVIVGSDGDITFSRHKRKVSLK